METPTGSLADAPRAPALATARGYYWFYTLSRAICWAVCKLWFRHGATGVHNIPKTGPVVLACNHASHLDPVLLGTMVPRRCWYLARVGLGRIPLLGRWMRGVGIVFIDRKSPGRHSLGSLISLLETGEVVGMFPEGTRTQDGRITPFERGLILLLKKSQARVVPVGLRGSFAALPPGGLFPKPRRCSVHFGPVWTADEVLAEGGLESLRQSVAELSGVELAE